MIVIAIVVSFVTCGEGPRLGYCPPGWSVSNVKPSGVYECATKPPPNCGEPRGPYEHVKCPPSTRINSFVICPPSRPPIFLSHLVAGCS